MSNQNGHPPGPKPPYGAPPQPPYPQGGYGPPPQPPYQQGGYGPPPQQPYGYAPPPGGYGMPQPGASPYGSAPLAVQGPQLGEGQLPCPRCAQPTTSMKSYTMVQFLLFVWFFAFWRRQVVTCCPGCMRKEIALKTLINVVPANLLWVFLVLPWHAVLFGMTFAEGHSNRVKQFFAQQR